MTTDIRTRQIVDMQLPLPWLLSSAAALLMFMAAMVWSVAGQSNKLDVLIASTAKLEKRVDERDTRLDNVKEAQYEARRVQDAQGIRIDALSIRMDALDRAVRK